MQLKMDRKWTKVMINLKFLQAKHIKAFASYHLTDEQLAFTVHPLEKLLSATQSSNCKPVGICHGKDIVGFFILQWGDIQPYSCDEDALLLRAYSIQQQYQGQGFAKQSMHELPVFVNGYFPDVRKVVLGVNRKNKLAQKVYLAGGFEDTGRRVQGQVGEQYIFQKNIKLE